MKLLFILSIAIFLLFSTLSFAADFQIRSTVNKDNDPVVAYNSVDDEYLVVWTEYSSISIEVMGQRMKADGTGSIGSAFSISTIGAFPSVAYNPQSNEYLVTFSLSGNIIGRRVGNTGSLIGNAVTLLSKTNSIYSKIIYNTLANNYLLVAGELFDLGNDQANIKIYARKITANGQPDGSEQLVRDQGHGNYSDGARFSVAYAPIISAETPVGRYLLAIKDPTDLTMMDDNGVIVSRVNDSQHPGNIVGDHVPFQSSKVGTPYDVDVAFGNFEGEDVFMVVWGDRDNQYNNQPWSGIWAGIVPAFPIEFDSNEGVSSTVFPVSAIPYHNISPTFSNTWKPAVSYNEMAYKFMIAWRETPTSDPSNDTKVNHIRANAVSSSIPNVTSNVVLSAISGNEDPKNPVICTSTKNTNAFVVWEDSRNIATKDIDLYGNLLTTTPAKALILASPNGGEIWLEGTEHQITWESSGIGATDIKIEYSTDHGASFSLIANQTNADGLNSYNWIVPNTPSTQCVVQITSGGLSDQSDELFTITEPHITIVEPNGGETWVVGSTKDIMWDNYYFSENVKIEYSTDWGLTYSTIASNITNNGTYSWLIPDTPSPNCLVRVSNANEDKPSDISNNVLSIVLPKLTITSPNYYENWIAGTKQNITWTSENIPNNDVTIEYNISTYDENYTFIDVVTNDEPTETYEWTVPIIDETNKLAHVCWIRISLNIQGVEISDVTDKYFYIHPQNEITVISPNGGEVWQAGSQQEIKWTSTIPSSETVKIGLYYVTDMNYIEIANVPNNGSYIWSLDKQAFPAWDNGRRWISISHVPAGSITGDYDVSDTYFTMIQNTTTGDSVKVDLGDGTKITFDGVNSAGTTTLNVLNTGSPPPNGFTIFGLPNYYNIETTSSFTGNVKICINYNDGGLTPEEESLLSLLVYETPPGQWKDITTSLDITNNIICGEVNHLSEFAIMTPTNDPQVIIVTNTNDDGDGSLRRAIEMANEHIGPDTIKFNISFGETNYDGSKGVWLIQPETNLPSIIDSNLVIDGTSQRLFIGEDVNKEGPEIEISGINLFESGNFLQSFTNGTEIYELIINNFGSTAIIFRSTNGGVISGCYIGTDYTGMKSESNRNGITLSFNASNNLIGPSKFLEKPNVISGNDQDGIYIVDSSSYNTIIGNYIGVNKIATDTIENKLRGIDIYKKSDNNTIIGNYVGGNYQGVFVYESNNNFIKSNYIGTNENWEYDLGNSDGIVISYNSSRNEISENLVRNNKGIGILISGSNSTQNKISRNSISNNLGFGIDNSEGGNNELSQPVILTVTDNYISGTAGANQVIEIFADSSYEGLVYIDSTVSLADGNFSLTITSLPIFPNITATARDVLGNTSEFSSPFIITDIEGKENSVPTEYALYQNYPNPFNPSTIISYQLPNPEHVLVKIYDVLGREVFTLVNQKQPAGKYEAIFDAKNLPSGVYFYQLKTKSNSLTKKMLLLE